MTEEKKQSVEFIDKKENIGQAENKGGMRYSGFWVRGAALIIDSIIVTIIVMVIGLPIIMVLSFISSFMGPVGMVINFLLSFAGVFIAWGYFVFMTHKYKATLGKMAVGVQVLSVDGNELSLGNITLRETVGKFISRILFGIGYIMAAFTKKKQALHDFIANSVVVYKDSQKGPNVPVVVITYALFSILMVFLVIVISSMIVVLGLIIASVMNDAGNSSTPV
jgi:uncharacterized RDD family membrane protein YckC